MGKSNQMAETLEQKIGLLPKDCIAEIELYVDFLLFREGMTRQKQQKPDVSDYFGAVKAFGDGLEFQRRARREWD